MLAMGCRYAIVLSRGKVRNNRKLPLEFDDTMSWVNIRKTTKGDNHPNNVVTQR